MAEPAQRTTSLKAPGPWFWTVAVVVYLLSVAAFLQYLGPGADLRHVPYYALQLFALEFNEVDGVEVPPFLQVMRVLAPAITISGAALTAAGESIRLWLRRTFTAGYTLVVGDTAEARSIAGTLRGSGRAAVFEVADGRHESLRRAGVERAGAIFVVGEDRGDGLPNVASALAAATASLKKTRVFVHVKDSELALGLRARDLMAERTQALEYFIMDELAARACVVRDELGPGARPEILVAGAGAFGRAVVVAFARHWRAAVGDGSRIAVTLVDRHAAEARTLLRDRWQIVEETCDITAIDTDDLAGALKVAGQPYRAYICYEDEQAALRAALTAQPLWHGGPGSLVVRLNELSEHAAQFPDGPLFDDLGDRLVVANVARLAGPFVAAQPDLFEDLAKAIHARYLVAQGTVDGQAAASAVRVPWAQLPEDYRSANLAQARDVARKLHLIGATIAPRSAANDAFALRAEEIELLAIEEHKRWVDERKAAGWRYAAERNNSRKLHPDLVEWDVLGEDSREKDRQAVRNLTEEIDPALRDIGLQIVRL